MERVIVALKVTFQDEAQWGEFIGVNNENEIVIASQGHIIRVHPGQIKDEIIVEDHGPRAD